MFRDGKNAIKLIGGINLTNCAKVLMANHMTYWDIKETGTTPHHPPLPKQTHTSDYLQFHMSGMQEARGDI